MSVLNRKNRRNPQEPTQNKERVRVNANGDAAPSTKTKIRRLLYKMRHDLVGPDTIIFALAIIFTLSWTWGAISALSRNWELAQMVESRKRELSIMKLEVDNLELENEYYKSAEYQELAARAKQNKLLAGETLIYLPENTEAAKMKHQETVIQEEVETPSNFNQWISFLFGT